MKSGPARKPLASRLSVSCSALPAVGSFKKALAHRAAPVATVPAEVPTPTSAPPDSLPTAPPSQQREQFAETQAALLLAQLKADPNNVGLLENIADIYYDSQQYPTAIDDYQRCLNVQPSNTSVRTDMATAIWYTGNADSAITEFNKSLTYEPTKANTLFNLGIVLWQGKHDVAGAVAA